MAHHQLKTWTWLDAHEADILGGKSACNPFEAKLDHGMFVCFLFVFLDQLSEM